MDVHFQLVEKITKIAYFIQPNLLLVLKYIKDTSRWA